MLAACLATTCPSTSAHPGSMAVAIVKVNPDGRLELTLRHDALAFALDEQPLRIADAPMYALLHEPDAVIAKSLADARDRFATLFSLLADGRRIDVTVNTGPTVAVIRAWQRMPLRRLPIMLDLAAGATLPPGTRSITLRFPEVLGDVIVTIDGPIVEPFAFPLRANEQSPEISVQLAGAVATPDHPESPDQSRPALGSLDVAWRYVALGFTHIVPHGSDHVLFVLGLFFLSPRIRALIWQVTAFTIAHSITLALAMLDVLSLSPSVVEPIIAASIALVAIENVVTDRVHAWRPAVVFVFGLIHGMGFAGVLRELGLPHGQLAAALVSFNVGVELGQLAVIAAALATVGWWRNRKWYRRAIAIPASLAIAVVGAIWTVQRLW